MHNQTYDAGICIMTKIVQLIGGKWKPIILYLIQHDINRFGVLKKCMPKISKKVLTNQLRELEKDELIVRHVHEVLAPQVITYTLTAKGTSIRRLIDDMIQWGLVYFKNDYPGEAIEKFVEP